MTKYLIKKILGWLLMIFLATNLAYFLAASFGPDPHVVDT